MTTFRPATPRLPSTAPSSPRLTNIRLAEYLALRQVPWSLAYVGFLIFFVVSTTYLVDIGTVAMVIATIGLALGSRRIRWPLPVWLLLIFWFWAAVSTSLSHFPGVIVPVVNLGKVLLVFLVAVNVLWHPQAVRIFLLLFVTCFALFPARGTIFNYYLYDYADFGRPRWVQSFGDPNDMAALAILALGVAAGFLHKEAPRVVRFGALLACLVFPFIVLLTQSRSGFIGLLVFLLLFVMSISRNRIRAWVALISMVTIVIAAAPMDVWERIVGLQYAKSTETINMADPEGSASQRWEIWQTGFQIIADHPVLGVGFGRYEQANLVYSPHLGPRDMHNTFLEVLAETGAPGLLLFLWLLIAILLRARRARRNARVLRDSAEWRRLQLLEFGLYAYLAAGIWGTYGFLSMLYIYLAILLAQADVLAALAAKPSTGLVTPTSVDTKV